LRIDLAQCPTPPGRYFSPHQERASMDSREYRTNARRCYRLAQQVGDTEARQTLLKLMVQWRELAEQIDRVFHSEQQTLH
jgi:hypothetical protein